MPEKQGTIQLKLTPEQQQEIQKATGKLTDTLEFSIMSWRSALRPVIEYEVF